MGEALLGAAADGGRDAGVRSPSPPPYLDSEDAPSLPNPVCMTTTSSGLAVDGWLASALSEQTTPSSGIFTPTPSWCPIAQLRPPPHTHTLPSIPAMKEHGTAQRASLVAAITAAAVGPPGGGAASTGTPSVRNSARSITSCSTCLSPEQLRLGYASPADSNQTPRPGGGDAEPAGAESGGPGHRGTAHSGWSEWFHPRDGAAEREAGGRRASSDSIGAVSIASSGVLTPSLVSLPVSARLTRIDAASGDLEVGGVPDVCCIY